MNNKPLTLICVQPCIPYYAWQVEVMLTNFQNIKIHFFYQIVCLFGYNKSDASHEQNLFLMKKVEEKFKGIADFYYYEDTRQKPIYYIPSIRPNLLKQHFAAFPELKEQKIFYHDCDIIFTRFPTFFEKYIQDDIWYVSDTVSYIGYDYILSKGEDILDKMCEIVGIEKEKVRLNRHDSGGAQYIMKGCDSDYFQKVEKDCETLYKTIKTMSSLKAMHDDKYHEIQIWCADMWSVLWGAWVKGKEVKVVKDLDFCWATDFNKRWDECYLYHNSGVTEKDKHIIFYKGGYINSFPYLDNFDKISKDRCSHHYVDLIKSIGKKSCLYDK